MRPGLPKHVLPTHTHTSTLHLPVLVEQRTAPSSPTSKSASQDEPQARRPDRHCSGFRDVHGGRGASIGSRDLRRLSERVRLGSSRYST